MNEKLPAPCQACHGSGLRDGSECRECGGKGYRLFVNGNQIPMRRSAGNASVQCSANSIPSAEPLRAPFARNTPSGNSRGRHACFGRYIFLPAPGWTWLSIGR